MAHQNREPPCVRDACPAVPAELAAVVTKMLAKRPVRRYQTPAELVAALEPWTRNPIAPPSEDEMPRLCPAVLGVGSTITSRNLTPSAVNLGSKIPAARSAAATTPRPSGHNRALLAVEPPAAPTVAARGAHPWFIWAGIVLGALAAGLCGYLLR